MTTDEETGHRTTTAGDLDKTTHIGTATSSSVSTPTDAVTARLLVAAALLLFLAIASQTTFADPDMFHELALAREIVARGAIPLDDVFAFTDTRSPTVHHEWGFGLLLFGLLKTCGPSGILLFRYALLIALFFGALRLALRRGATGGALLASALPVIAMAHYVDLGSLRAQTPTLALALITLTMIERDRNGERRWLIFWFPMLLIWQNLHGGFVVGVGLIGLHSVEQAIRREPIRHLALVLLASLAMMPIHPWGFDYPLYLARALTMARPEITEWRSLAGGWWPMLAVFIATSGVVVTAARRRLATRGLQAISGLLIVIAVSILAIRHQRHLSLYALVFITQVTPWFSRPSAFMAQGNARRLFILRYAAIVVGIPFLALFIEGAPHRLPVPANPGDHPRLLYPSGATRYLSDQSFHGRVMTPFTAGAFVSWVLHPQVQVSLDGRYEVAYQDGVLEKHLQFYRAEEGWRRSLEDIVPDVVLIPTKSRIAEEGLAIPDWPVVYRDDAFVLLASPQSGLEAIDMRGRRTPTTFPASSEIVR